MESEQEINLETFVAAYSIASCERKQAALLAGIAAFNASGGHAAERQVGDATHKISRGKLTLQVKLPKLLFTLKDTAEILSVSEKSVRRLLNRGQLKTSPALRTKLITRESIESFAKHTV
jgi:hypothetical protein